MKYGLPKLAKTGEQVGFKTVANMVYTSDGTTVQDHLDRLNNESTNVSLNTLKIGIMGDGIVGGIGLDDPNTSYAALLGQHFASYVTYTASGKMITYVENNTAGHPTPMSIEYASMDADLDVILVNASTNDWYYSIPMGTATDTGNTTYYGALNTLILGLQDRYPSKDIFFITPVQRADETGTTEITEPTSDEPNTEGFVLKDYNDVLKEVCAYHAVPVLDLFANGGMNIVHSMAHRNHYTTDGVHLSVAGHEKMFKYIFNEIVAKI